MSDIEATIPEAATPPTPETRIRPGATGTPVVLADGREWLLATAPPELSTCWADLYADGCLHDAYDPGDVLTAAMHLLRGNYDLTVPEAHTLIVGAPDLQALIEPVERAIRGPDLDSLTYTDWIELSLLGAGLDPDRIPPDRRVVLVNLLVQAGRALPAADVIWAAAEARRRAKWEADGDKWKALAKPKPDAPMPPAPLTPS